MSDSDAHLRVLISTKGVLRWRGRVLLVKNARAEWELPGGKLEAGESLRECLQREIQEEVGLAVGVSEVLDVFQHHYYDDIVVVVYDCGELGQSDLILSEEHSDGDWFRFDQIVAMNVPDNYRRVIQRIYGDYDSAADV